MPNAPHWINALRGRFIALEGADGSGKSTQLARLLDLLSTQGLPVVNVREPGGTSVGERIRDILLDRNSEMTLHCEMLLYMASRAQLIDERISPALRRGDVVIADRFVSSTYAYQGAAGGVPAADIDHVAAAALRGALPDLVVIFDVDSITAAKRTQGLEKVGKRKVAAPATASLFADRIEQRPAEFHARVRESYLEQARAQPARHLVIDASKAPDDVWNDLQRSLEGWCVGNPGAHS